MIKFKGTKGKFNNGFKGWKSVEYSNNNKVGFSTHEIHYSDDGECVAEVVHGKHNAQLIASAPIMLEALQNLENDNGQIPPHAWEMVQKAIKKAIG